MEYSFINASQWKQFENQEYIEYRTGTDPKFFRGFAWLRIEKKTNKIIATRDHFGQQPFYYIRDKKRFIFGSSIEDILYHLEKPPDFSSHLIRDCFLRYPADDPKDDPPYSQETYRTGIFRVTPGHSLEMTAESSVERPFWKLDPSKPKLFYADPREYVAHFEYLLNEAIQVTTLETEDLALEFSGGIDSSLVLLALNKNKIDSRLFTHIPPSNRPRTAEDQNVAYLIEKLGYTSKHISVNANEFEPIPVFQYFAERFSSPPPNLNCVLSNNLHNALLNHKHRFLLSGYGGDDCVSLIFPEAIKYSPEAVYEYEIDIIQGKRAHDIRMRLEYSAVVARAMGFQYIYPLLYPPLIEFCVSLPIEQKLKNDVMRCTAREYLLQQDCQMNFSTKTGAVVPDTMQKCRDYYRKGLFKHDFEQLPFAPYITQRTTDDDKMLLQIHAYMAKHAQSVQHNRRRPRKTCTT